MRFLAVEVRSFVRFAEPFTLSLARQGLVLVEGRNQDRGDAFDSNGAGKSSLFEAITWALFGKMSRYGDERLGGEEVCVDGREADVTVTFESAKGKFRARRRRRPTGSPSLVVEVLRDGEWAPLRGVSPGVSLATDDLTTLLGFDYQTLRSALFLQGTGLDLASSGFARQMKMLESVLRFDIFTRAAKVARDRLTALEAERAQLVTELDRHAMIVRNAIDAIDEMEKLDESEREQVIEQRVAELKDITSRGDALRKRLRGIEVEFEAAQQRLAQTEARVEVCTEQQRTLKTVAEECPTCKTELSPSTRARLQRECDREMAALVKQREEDAARVTQLRRKRESVSGELQQTIGADRELKNLEIELADLRRRRDLRLSVIRERAAARDEAENVVVALTEQVADHGRATARARFWVSGFGSDGLKAEVLSAAVPVLNDAARRYSDVLTDGAIAVEFAPLRDSTSESMIRVSGESAPTFDGLSNGEKRRASVIVALALRALARWRLAEPVNLAVWDEVFDPLDESGVRRALQVLQQDMDELESTYVITHSAALKAQFPGARTLMIDREGGVSRIIR